MFCQDVSLVNKTIICEVLEKGCIGVKGSITIRNCSLQASPGSTDITYIFGFKGSTVNIENTHIAGVVCDEVSRFRLQF